MSPPQCYVIDTSALIDFQEWYSRKTFPSLWESIENLAKDGRLICPREVARELERQNPDLKNWLDSNGMVISDQDTVDLIDHAANVDRKYPDLKTGRHRSHPNPRSADPWVVGLAVSEGATVICSERARPDAHTVRTIPDACRAEGIRCLTLQQFFEELQLSF